MINLIIDQQKISVPEGTSILEAARTAGIEIPNLCYDPELTVVGACRLCVVEVEGARNLVAACSTAVTEGMVVQTDSPAVVGARRGIIDLLLANHPRDCMTCQKFGNCKLAGYAYLYGVRKSSFTGEKRNEAVDTGNPCIERDMNKCMLCGKCVRVCAEVQGRHVVDFSFRGFGTKIATAFDTSLRQSDCVSCGSYVALCPTGALTETMMKGRGRTWEVKKVRTTCPYCGCGCNFDLNVKDNQVIGVTSNPDSPVNGRHLCVKGRFGYDFIHSPERLTDPLIKENGEFKKVSWQRAIDFVAERLAEIRQQHGCDALAVLSSARCTNEENYLLNKFTRAVLGTNNIDHCARLCHASTVAGLALAYGSGAMTNSIKEIRDVDFILVIGSNTTETHPIISLEIRKALKNGAQLAVADPRKIELTGLADFHLQLRPGTNVALLNGLINVIITENLWDQDFVDKRTEDFNAMRETALKYSPEYVAGITGVDAELIRQAARAYAGAKNASIFYTMGITQHSSGTNNVLAIANLAMLCGQLGKPGSGVNPLRGQNNVQGACDMGALPNVFPGYQPVADPANVQKFSQAWGTAVPGKVGLTVGEMMDEALKGNIKGMYIMGENPMLSDPDINHGQKALENLEFLVVQDIFLTETARLADVVLPGTSFAEKDGTFTNTERRVQRVRKAIDPVGNAKPDWQIICTLAEKMGCRQMQYTHPAEVMAEIARLTPVYGGISYDRLVGQGLQWPCPDMNHPGTPYLHKDKFTRGPGKFYSVEYSPPAEMPDSEFPFILTTGRRLYHYHTGTMTRRARGIEAIYSEEFLEINPLDADKLGICDRDPVKLSSRRGSITIKACITERVSPGTVFTSFHFAEHPINMVTNSARDPVAKIPELKVCAVRIEKVS